MWTKQSEPVGSAKKVGLREQVEVWGFSGQPGRTKRTCVPKKKVTNVVMCTFSPCTQEAEAGRSF